MNHGKNKAVHKALLTVIAVTVVSACDIVGGVNNGQTQDFKAAPEYIRTRALEIAQYYIGMDYEYGGQDHYSTISALGIDCSGLVVNAYEEAVIGTPYALPFYDAAVVNFLNTYTTPIETPEPGDLTFMGEDSVTHIAIYEKTAGDNIVFIDAFETDGNVQERSYDKDNPKFKSFGRLLVVSRY